MNSRLGSHKLVLLGETFVGKSSLVLRFVRGQFNEILESTVGAAFMTQTVMTMGKTIKFEIWDTAGQERYRSLAPMYYRGARAAIVMYDITNSDSFENAKSWIEELKIKAPSVEVIVLVGNKIDLQDSRKVSPVEGEQHAKDNGLMFMEISVKDSVNVNEVFIEIGKFPWENNYIIFDVDEAKQLPASIGENVGENAETVDRNNIPVQDLNAHERGCSC